MDRSAIEKLDDNLEVHVVGVEVSGDGQLLAWSERLAKEILFYVLLR